MPFPDADFPASAYDIREGIAASAVQPLYRHFKGGWYRVMSVAKNAVSGEPDIVYLSLHFGTVHTRSASEFFGSVVREAYTGPRFMSHPEPIPATQNPAWREKYPHLC